MIETLPEQKISKSAKQRVAWMTSFLLSPSVSAGDRASFRRAPSSKPPPEFYRVLAMLERFAYDGALLSKEATQHWWLFTQNFAILAAVQSSKRIEQLSDAEDEATKAFANPWLNTNRSMGHALYEGGKTQTDSEKSPAAFSELRLNKLLTARGTQFHDSLRRACRMLASKNEKFLAFDLYCLISPSDPTNKYYQEIRQRIARSYYSINAKNSTNPVSGKDKS